MNQYHMQICCKNTTHCNVKCYKYVTVRLYMREQKKRAKKSCCEKHNNFYMSLNDK